MPHHIAVLVGSLRRESLSGKAARALAALAPASLAFDLVNIGGLPLYNEDRETDPPEPWTGFRAAIARADGLLFVTPEYNRTIPGGLKNAIDIASRPWGKNVFAGKPAAIASQSPGMVGGFGASQTVRQALVCLDVPVLPGPELYLAASSSAFDADGNLSSDTARDLMAAFVASFARWVDHHDPVRAEGEPA